MRSGSMVASTVSVTSLPQPPSAGASLQHETVVLRCLYWARNLRSRQMFRALRQYCRGQVLDVGGYDFFLTARKLGVTFDHWTNLEACRNVASSISDPRYSFVYGDGCAMPELKDATFDTTLSIQVVEHVVEPLKMVSEMARVLKPGGHAILLVPQTSVLHMAPNHFYNFTRYWILEAVEKAGLELVSLTPIGGWWSTRASHSVYFFLQAFRVEGYHVPGLKRSPLFLLLLPFMCLFEIVSFPLSLLFTVADMPEGANNHLVIARKPVRAS